MHPLGYARLDGFESRKVHRIGELDERSHFTFSVDGTSHGYGYDYGNGAGTAQCIVT